MLRLILPFEEHEPQLVTLFLMATLPLKPLPALSQVPRGQRERRQFFLPEQPSVAERLAAPGPPRPTAAWTEGTSLR